MTENPLHPTTPTLKKSSKKGLALKLVLTLIFIALGVGLGTTAYLYYQTKQELQQLSTPQGQQRLSEREIQDVLEKLGKLTLLPEETPVLATIIDAPLLATQSAFYEHAQNGDKVVAFPQAKKAFIFSVDRNIIVNSGPLITQPSAVEPFSIEIRNGSSTVGLGERIRTDLEAKGATVATVQNAANRDYTQTQVIGLTKKAPANILGVLATYLSGTVVSSAPAAEPSSTADVLIIIGNGTTAIPAASATPQASAKPTL